VEVRVRCGAEVASALVEVGKVSGVKGVGMSLGWVVVAERTCVVV
jgi:hypothetical protein